MGFLDDIVGTALGMNDFKNDLLSMKDEVVSSVIDLGDDAKTVLDDTVQTVKDLNPLDEGSGE